MFESERTKKIVFAFWLLWGQADANGSVTKEQFEKYLAKINNEKLTETEMFNGVCKEIQDTIDESIKGIKKTLQEVAK